jgi:signal transduction histidine kinase
MGISHDIRSPLAAVISATSLMDSEHLSTEAKKTYIQTAKKSAAGLIEMIDELLEVSSIESRAVKVNIKRFNLHDFLGYIIESHRLVAEEKSLNLELDNTRLSIEDLDSDSHLLQRILSNLLTNAVKYSNQGTISLIVSNDSEFLFMEVKDTGIGIDEDKLADIFDLYSKLGDESSRRKDSHGLGLFIVKNLVSTLGGEVTVSSQLGVGSTVFSKTSATLISLLLRCNFDINSSLLLGDTDISKSFSMTTLPPSDFT